MTDNESATRRMGHVLVDHSDNLPMINLEHPRLHDDDYRTIWEDVSHIIRGGVCLDVLVFTVWCTYLWCLCDDSQSFDTYGLIDPTHIF